MTALRRIGIDLRIVHYARSGFHRYAQGLIEAIRRFPPSRARFVLLRHPEDTPPAPLAEHLEERVAATPLFAADESDRLRCELEPLALDEIHFPFGLFPGRIAPRVILTIHDLAALRFPECFEERYRPHYASAIDSAAEADLVTVHSHAVAGELRALGVPAARIQVCAPTTAFERALGEGEIADAALLARASERPFLLSVGSIEPRKNHAAAVAIFAELRRRSPEPSRLLIVGGHAWLAEEFSDACARHPFREDVWILRDVNDATLAGLLRRCRLFLNLSRYEGFGLPVTEALAAGACVLSTPVPSLVEAGCPQDGLLPGDAPGEVIERVIALFGDDAARESLAARERAPVGSFYRALEPDRLARPYRVAASDAPEHAIEVSNPRPIEVAGRSLLVCQIHYDERSAARIDPRFTPVRNRALGKFFESGVIAGLLAAGVHRRADFFGVFSWRFCDKIPLGAGQIVARIGRDGAACDVYSFFGAVADRRLWVVAERKHPGILDAASLLMERLGFAIDLAALTAPVVYQNHFVARAACYERFHEEMLRPALERMSDPADAELADRLARDAGYVDPRVPPARARALYGRPHLCLHPFVAERLFGTWLALHPEVRVRQIWRGRFVEKRNVAHEPELPRAGAVR